MLEKLRRQVLARLLVAGNALLIVPAVRCAGNLHPETHSLESSNRPGRPPWRSHRLAALDARCWLQAEGSEHHGSRPLTADKRACQASSCAIGRPYAAEINNCPIHLTTQQLFRFLSRRALRAGAEYRPDAGPGTGRSDGLRAHWDDSHRAKCGIAGRPGENPEASWTPEDRKYSPCRTLP